MTMLNLQEKSSVQVTRAREDGDGLELKGRFLVEHWRDGEKIGEYEFHNLVTNEGKNRLFNTLFRSAVAPAALYPDWWVGLISVATNSTVLTTSATDNYAGIGNGNGWTEFTGYTVDAANTVNTDGSATTITSGSTPSTSTARVPWAAVNASAAGSSSTISNSAAAVFDITGTGPFYIAGAFICGGPIGSAGTKGDHSTGVLWSEGAFSTGTNTCNNGDQLKFTYSVTA